mgnify:CR=1 FL=1
MDTNPFLLRQPQSELRLVAEFQQQSVLDSLRLKEFRARSGELPEEASGSLRLDLQHETRCGELKANKAQFEVALKMRAALTGGAELTLFELDCCLEANYTLAPNFEPSEEQLAAFRKGNVLFHCWPYLRELVHNTTWRMGLMLPPLPLLRVIPEAAAKPTTARKTQKKTRLSTKREA